MLIKRNVAFLRKIHIDEASRFFYRALMFLGNDYRERGDNSLVQPSTKSYRHFANIKTNVYFFLIALMTNKFF
jgi:hypothetical protein